VEEMYLNIYSDLVQCKRGIGSLNPIFQLQNINVRNATMTRIETTEHAVHGITFLSERGDEWARWTNLATRLFQDYSQRGEGNLTVLKESCLSGFYQISHRGRELLSKLSNLISTTLVKPFPQIADGSSCEPFTSE
jgi:hypothetical protein